MRSLASLALAATLALLAACAPIPAPTADGPSASSTPSASPSPTPTANPVTLVIRSTGLEWYEDGTLTAAHGWLEDPEATVTLLTETFGVEPVLEPFTVRNENENPGTDYVWDGVTLSVYDQIREVPYVEPRMSMGVTTAEVGGVSITTIQGFGVGTPESSVAASSPWLVQHFVESNYYPEHTLYLLDVGPLTYPSQTVDNKVGLRCVDGAVAVMFAPVNSGLAG